MTKKTNHYIDNNDIRSVNKSLKSEFITGGYYNKKFTQDLKKYLNAKHVTLCSSGTSALHLAFLSINLKPSDIVIMPAINFIASYNMAKKLGAKWDSAKKKWYIFSDHQHVDILTNHWC